MTSSSKLNYEISLLYRLYITLRRRQNRFHPVLSFSHHDAVKMQKRNGKSYLIRRLLGSTINSRTESNALGFLQ